MASSSKPDERAGHAGLRLTTLAEEHQVLAREDGVLDRRHDRVVVAHDARQDLGAGRDAREQIGAEFVLHGSRPPSRRPQSGDRGGTLGGRHGSFP